VNRSGQLLLTSIQTRMTYFFVFWLLVFSSLRFAEGKSWQRNVVVSAVTSVAMLERITSRELVSVQEEDPPTSLSSAVLATAVFAC